MCLRVAGQYNVVMTGNDADLLAGVDDGESGEEALSNGLLDDLEGGTDEGLAGNDGRQGGQNEHGIKGPIWQ